MSTDYRVFEQPFGVDCSAQARGMWRDGTVVTVGTTGSLFRGVKVGDPSYTNSPVWNSDANPEPPPELIEAEERIMAFARISYIGFVPDLPNT